MFDSLKYFQSFLEVWQSSFISINIPIRMCIFYSCRSYEKCREISNFNVYVPFADVSISFFRWNHNILILNFTQEEQSKYGRVNICVCVCVVCGYRIFLPLDECTSTHMHTDTIKISLWSHKVVSICVANIEFFAHFQKSPICAKRLKSMQSHSCFN